VPPLVVVTWNLQRRDPAAVQLAAAIGDWQADLVVLQEADGDRAAASLPASFRTRLWWPSAGSRPGIVIASHLGLDESGVLDPVDPPWDRPRVCWARLQGADGPLLVAAVHLLAPLLPGVRRRRDAQRAELAGWCEAQVAGGTRLVVAGDFNTQNPSLPRMIDACAADPLPTWRPLATTWMRPLLRLDAIFVSPVVRVVEAGIGDRWRGSDHLPVAARIVV
jgi:endonuclease/exonuclease/phosphatase family metal-dependent hydrolase